MAAGMCMFEWERPGDTAGTHTCEMVDNHYGSHRCRCYDMWNEAHEGKPEEAKRSKGSNGHLQNRDGLGRGQPAQCTK